MDATFLAEALNWSLAIYVSSDPFESIESTTLPPGDDDSGRPVIRLLHIGNHWDLLVAINDPEPVALPAIYAKRESLPGPRSVEHGSHRCRRCPLPHLRSLTEGQVSSSVPSGRAPPGWCCIRHCWQTRRALVRRNPKARGSLANQGISPSNWQWPWFQDDEEEVVVSWLPQWSPVSPLGPVTDLRVLCGP